MHADNNKRVIIIITIIKKIQGIRFPSFKPNKVFSLNISFWLKEKNKHRTLEDFK